MGAACTTDAAGLWFLRARNRPADWPRRSVTEAWCTDASTASTASTELIKVEKTGVVDVHPVECPPEEDLARRGTRRSRPHLHLPKELRIAAAIPFEHDQILHLAPGKSGTPRRERFPFHQHVAAGR